MATLRKIVTDAYRESGIIQKNSVPDAAQLEEGLDKLLMLIQDVFGEEVGGPYEDVNFGANGVVNWFSVATDNAAYVNQTYVRPSFRLLMNSASPSTIYLDPEPYDGARIAIIDVSGNFSTNPVTLVADTRKIEGGRQVVLNTNGTNTAWFYRADLAEWVKIAPLDLDSMCPFPFEFDDYFIIRLAMRLHPRYLVDTRNESMLAFRKIERKFRSRYSTKVEMPVEAGLVRLSRTAYNQYFIGNNSVRFDKGIIR